MQQTFLEKGLFCYGYRDGLKEVLNKLVVYEFGDIEITVNRPDGRFDEMSLRLSDMKKYIIE